jgi:hypothetical protein
VIEENICGAQPSSADRCTLLRGRCVHTTANSDEQDFKWLNNKVPESSRSG